MLCALPCTFGCGISRTRVRGCLVHRIVRAWWRGRGAQRRRAPNLFFVLCALHHRSWPCMHAVLGRTCACSSGWGYLSCARGRGASRGSRGKRAGLASAAWSQTALESCTALCIVRGALVGQVTVRDLADGRDSAFSCDCECVSRGGRPNACSPLRACLGRRCGQAVRAPFFSFFVADLRTRCQATHPPVPHEAPHAVRRCRVRRCAL